MERELAHREIDALCSHSDTDRLSVVVHNWRVGDWFELRAQPANALDVFDHPYAYAAANVASEPVYA